MTESTCTVVELLKPVELSESEHRVTMAVPVVVMAPEQYTWIFAVTMIFAFLDGYAIGECSMM